MNTEAARILAVDDEPAVLGLLHHVLEQENYQVLKAADGRAGLSLAKTEQPDLILLDINLPDISGIDVCRKLKADADTSRIPVIFLTGAEQDESEFRGFSAGAADFLRKPISRERLCVRVRNVLESKSATERLEQQARDLALMNERLKESLIMQEQVRRTLLQRDQILCAVNYVAKTFLQTPRWQDVIDEVLGYLGNTVNCEHVYLRVFADSVSPQQDYSWSRQEQCGPKCSSIELLSAWRQPFSLLGAGRPLIGVDNVLPDEMRAELEKNNIRTCLILPVYVAQTVRGCLGFDCSLAKRSWEASLVRAMMISADVIGIALQRSQESEERRRLAAAIREFADCVLITDAAGQIIYANPASRSVTGWEPQELTGRDLSRLSGGEEQQPDWQEIFADAARQGQWHGELRSCHKDGSPYEESVAVVPVKDSHGGMNGFCVIRRDQTEKKRLECIAAAANLMENVGFVFSGVRHELANPLNSLKMALSVLRRQMDSLGREKIREFLDRSMGEIGRMEYLLSALKNFNLLEKPQSVPFDLTAFIQKFKRLHEQDLRHKGIRLELSSEGALHCLADERILHQVLLNLLVNSVNALKKQLSPVISISLARSKPQCVQIRFQDNGCGFTQQVREQLFKPFFTTRINGTGLGLTIVKKMLTAMNCTVTMDGKEGAGAWAVITLPEAVPSEERARKEKEQA
ncbi:response regulator [Candidatus Electronema sp. JM]|uniref:ATP-binding response regulator n=1 Tax=Candidatus Electronema sp. JM TaxID=3401571 RepID=UPI003AA9375D